MQNPRRFIACTQSTGRVGKSTFAEGLISWLRFADIDFAAVDADTQNQTLSRRYPDKVTVFDATRTFDDFSQMIQELPPAPVILVDFPAQATAFLLEAAAHFNLIEFFERISVRPTLLIFAADDPTAEESAAGTIEFFEDAADYLLIENPARFKSSEFTQIAINTWLQERLDAYDPNSGRYSSHNERVAKPRTPIGKICSPGRGQGLRGPPRLKPNGARSFPQPFPRPV